MTGSSNPEELVENLKKAAHSDTRTSQEAKEAVVEAGPAVIPYLLPLLSNDDEQVRLLAGWAVSEIKGLREEHLDTLIQAYRKGVRLVATGIARIEVLAQSISSSKLWSRTAISTGDSLYKGPSNC